MKKIIILVLIFLASSAYAATLMWQPPITGEPLGYKIYYNEFSKDVGGVLELDNFETVLNLVPGLEYSLTCAAYNSVGEGPQCSPLSYTRILFIPSEVLAPVIINIPPGAPVTINVSQ